MPHQVWLFVVAMLAVLVTALPARAQSDEDRYTIMRPEPWLPPKYQPPRGSRQHVVPTPPVPVPVPVPQPRASVPPALYVPQTGRTLPNLPTPAPSGPNGSETYQDRAARCTHQAGVYGAAAGDRTSYINSCINQ